MTPEPDPVVLEILYDSIEDDGLYLGVPRDGNCLRCIRINRKDSETGQVSINAVRGNHAFCDTCMNLDLDRSQAVRRIMFGMRRTSKS